jgi:uncharacterized protein YfiM (DUF2279 family)
MVFIFNLIQAPTSTMPKHYTKLFLSLIIFLNSLTSIGQIVDSQDSTLVKKTEFVPDFRTNFPDSIDKKRLKRLAWTQSGLYVGGFAYVGLIWYKDAAWQPLTFFDDNNEWEQVDKAGHAYTSYHLSQRGYYAMRRAGLSKTKALLFGGTLGTLLLTPVELFDGFTDEYGFSKGDMVANLAGNALFVGQEILFDQQIIKLKFSYHFSEYAPYIPNQLGRTIPQRIFKDYNGHTYWASINLDKALGGHTKIPKWLCLSVGYGADGALAKFLNPYPYYKTVLMPYFPRYKQYYLSFDVDFNKIKTRSVFLKKVFSQLNLLKIPAPTLEWNTHQGFTVKGFYF